VSGLAFGNQYNKAGVPTALNAGVDVSLEEHSSDSAGMPHSQLLMNSPSKL
jgi:hypothetical protein